MDITQILLSAQSADHATRSSAERVLKDAEEKNFGSFLTTLADHLAGNDNDPESRRLAGLIIKNAVYSRELSVRQNLVERWIRTVDEPSKTHVRHALLRALAAVAPEARRAAAQVIAKVAAIDVGRPGGWDSLLTDLLSSASSQAEDHVKQASLEALGYTCEEAAYGDSMEQVLAAHSNQILTAVIQGMAYPGGPASTEKSASLVRLAATVALNNTLEFASSQFEIPNERLAIVTTICEAAKAGDPLVRQAAFEGLVKVAENYYDKLHQFIRNIYELTENAIRIDIENVAMQAIEFWSTVAEEEATIQFDIDAARESGKISERENKHFVADALPYLSGPIFDSLKKQEDDPLEDSSWNTATAAGACIELLAQAAPQVILRLIKPFIETNIRDQSNWRSREAAILAFGSVLEGPPVEDVRALVKEAITVLIDTLVKDPVLAVKDTTAWTLARVVLVDRETTVAYLPALVECLRGSLASAENPELAAHICFAIHNVAECFSNEADLETGPLTEHIEGLMQSLIEIDHRDDAGEANLRISAYETINAIFRAVSMDGVKYVYSCIPVLLEKLQTTLAKLPRSFSEDEMQDGLERQGLLCGALTTATHRLDVAQVGPYADRMMESYLAAFRISGSSASLEDAFLAVGAVAHVVGKEFNRYMQHFMPILQQALSNLSHHQMVGVAVGVTGEVCRAMGPELVHYADNIVYLLLEALKSTTLDRAIKPTILTCFGDIAMSIKGNFETYLKQVMACMSQAAESSVHMEITAGDYDTLDWVHLLRESVLEAYTGILSGLKDDGKQEALRPYVEWVISFCEVMITRPLADGEVVGEDLVKSIMALFGDLGDAIPGFKEVARRKEWVHAVVVERGARSADERTREIAAWAYNTIFNQNN